MPKPLLPVILHRWICQETKEAVLVTAVRILQNIDGIAHIELDEEDVVRHRLVKQILRAYTKETEKDQMPPADGIHRSLGILKRNQEKE